jgi:hypothetical protein
MRSNSFALEKSTSIFTESFSHTNNTTQAKKMKQR